MNKRQIKYIEPEEDVLELEVDWAVNHTMEQRLIEYCNHIIRNYAVAGINVREFPVKRNIYYIENEE